MVGEWSLLFRQCILDYENCEFLMAIGYLCCKSIIFSTLNGKIWNSWKKKYQQDKMKTYYHKDVTPFRQISLQSYIFIDLYHIVHCLTDPSSSCQWQRVQNDLHLSDLDSDQKEEISEGDFNQFCKNGFRRESLTPCLYDVENHFQLGLKHGIACRVCNYCPQDHFKALIKFW